MLSHEMRYQCLALAHADLADRSAHYTYDELFDLAKKFISFIENEPISEQQNKLPNLTPAEYIEKYISIVHPARGTIPFKLYDYQRDALDTFATFDITLINSARQMGMSTLIAAYLFQRAFTMPNQTLVMIGLRNRDAKECFEKLNVMYKPLEWTGPKLTSSTSRSFEFDNGSRILAQSCNVNALRGLCPDVVVLDQFGSVKEDTASALWATMLPAIATASGKIIVVTTPNEVGSFYHRLWTTAEEFKNVGKIELPYTLHPERAATTNDYLRKQLGEETFVNEYECRFRKLLREFDLRPFGLFLDDPVTD